MTWLLAWLWQGMLLVVVMDAALRLAPRLGAASRHAVWWLVLAAVLALPWLGGTAVSELLAARGWPATSAVAAGGALGLPVVPLLPAGPFVPLDLGLPAAPLELIVLVVVLWLGIVSVRLLRLVAGVRRLLAIKRRVRPFPVPVQARLTGWNAVRHGGRVARLAVCDELPGASVLGLGTPIIAVPSRLVAHLTIAELDDVVLHERAHVCRFDDWGRLAQAAIEAIAGLHPAVWWIGRRLDLEREAACDDWAVEGREPRSYALCLTKVAAASARIAWPAPGMVGHRSALARRVGRLLEPRRDGSPRVSSRALAAGAVGLAATIVAVLHVVPPVASEDSRPAAPWVDAPELPVGGEAALDDGRAWAEAVTVSTQLASVVPSMQVDARALADTPRSTASPEPRPATGPTTSPPATAADAGPSVGSAVDSADRSADAVSVGDFSGAASEPGADTRRSIDALALEPQPPEVIVPALTVVGTLDRAPALEEPTPVSRPAVTAVTAAADARATSVPGDDVGRSAHPAVVAGMAVGRSAKEAGLATAGFFSRMGKSIARAF